MDLISMAVGAAIGMVLVVIAVLIIVAMKKPEDISWLKEIWQKQLDQNERKINIMQSIDYGVQGLISVLKSEKTDPYEAFQNWMRNHGFSDVANWKSDEFDSERLTAAVDSYYKMKIGRKPFRFITYQTGSETMGAKIGLSEAYAKIMVLVEVLGVDLLRTAGVYECQVDDIWRVYVNPHPIEMCCSDADLKPLPPFHAYISFKGKPASLISPDEGWFLTWNGCTEEKFVEAVDQRIESENRFAIIPDALCIVGDGEAEFSELEGQGL